MFDEPEIWRDIRNFPGYKISSEGHVRDGNDELVLSTHKNMQKEPLIKFSYFNYSYQGPIWRLVLYGFFEFNMSDWKEVICDYRDKDPSNLDVFNLSFWKTDGSPIMFTRIDNGDWRRVRKYAKKVHVVETGDIYESAREASIALSAPLNTLYVVLRGKQDTWHGLHFEYLE